MHRLFIGIKAIPDYWYVLNYSGIFLENSRMVYTFDKLSCETICYQNDAAWRYTRVACFNFEVLSIKI